MVETRTGTAGEESLGEGADWDTRQAGFLPGTSKTRSPDTIAGTEGTDRPVRSGKGHLPRDQSEESRADPTGGDLT